MAEEAPQRIHPRALPRHDPTMEEPDDPQHLLHIIDMIGCEEFLMFATDYPHWDFDSPARALPPAIDGALRQGIRVDNAEAFYGFAAR